MIEEMEKQRTPMMSTKIFCFINFGTWINCFCCLWCPYLFRNYFITALQYTGLNQNGMITVCMVGAGILSITSISVIDKLFLENGRVRRKLLFQYKTVCCCMAGIVGYDKCYDIVLIAGYLNYHWSVGLLQVGLYILTPYLVSSITALGILSMETRGKNSSLFGMSAIFYQ